ncbi:hypothetical protein F4804DRAFT_310458 [Jackrogersella minutella]|nr:hypothetical protein F4804DRAFT_310458 [Jackrogersella minutella]
MGSNHQQYGIFQTMYGMLPTCIYLGSLSASLPRAYNYHVVRRHPTEVAANIIGRSKVRWSALWVVRFLGACFLISISHSDIASWSTLLITSSSM